MDGVDGDQPSGAFRTIFLALDHESVFSAFVQRPRSAFNKFRSVGGHDLPVEFAGLLRQRFADESRPFHTMHFNAHHRFAWELIQPVARPVEFPQGVGARTRVGFVMVLFPRVHGGVDAVRLA